MDPLFGASQLAGSRHRREEAPKVLQPGLDALTASERRVAPLAADGLSNEEIAQALFVTIKTVEVHLSHVHRKLEISSRAQLDRPSWVPHRAQRLRPPRRRPPRGPNDP